MIRYTYSNSGYRWIAEIAKNVFVLTTELDGTVLAVESFSSKGMLTKEMNRIAPLSRWQFERVMK